MQNKKRNIVILAAVVFALPLLLAHAALGFEVPELKGRVSDYADIITADIESALNAKLEALEAEDSTQIAVLTVDSLNGVPIEEYGLRVAETWGIGQKGKDNGALLLVAFNEREVRIETGYGLEGSLTDLICSSIIRNEIVPSFKAGDYGKGIEAGIDAMIGIVKGEYTPAEDAVFRSSSPKKLIASVAATVLFILISGWLIVNGWFLSVFAVCILVGIGLSAAFLSTSVGYLILGGVVGFAGFLAVAIAADADEPAQKKKKKKKKKKQQQNPMGKAKEQSQQNSGGGNEV